MRRREKQDRFLIKRGGRWVYQRRVPARYAHIDARRFIKFALRTDSIEIARERRDALARADDEYWAMLSAEAAGRGGPSKSVREVAIRRHEAAAQRAMAFGFSYQTADGLAQNATISELIERIRLLESQIRSEDTAPSKAATEALLGGVPEPDSSLTVSEAFELYLREIAFDEQYRKSPKQKYSWEKTKRTSINYFIDVVGDTKMTAITREDALAYRSWWMERMLSQEDGTRPAKPNTANRHIGNMRTLYEAYFRHLGEEERPNPFRRLFFKSETRADVPQFENDWVRTRILQPGVFDALNDELRLMVYALIETGCRVSELCNLTPENIRLAEPVPYLAIRAREDRELKTPTSERDIPLVGVALEAMRQAPNGFPNYIDKGELVSANLLKAFRNRSLFPTDKHVIYSFRHAFEKRMLEAASLHLNGSQE